MYTAPFHFSSIIPSSHSAVYITVANMTSSPPKITLYTNRLCPWAHRAHIALQELNLPYEEVTIDLSKPREPWYLEINPVRT